jgi:hypothetical protein
LATRISCTWPHPTTACAAFSKESRMKFANANKLHRKIRARGTRPGVRVLCGLSGFSHRLFRASHPWRSCGVISCSSCPGKSVPRDDNFVAESSIPRWSSCGLKTRFPGLKVWGWHNSERFRSPEKARGTEHPFISRQNRVAPGSSVQATSGSRQGSCE